jgi:Crp-like helix-turn-helix protein
VDVSLGSADDSCHVLPISGCNCSDIDHDSLTVTRLLQLGYLVRSRSTGDRRQNLSAGEALAAASFLAVKGRLARALLELAEFLGGDRGSGRVLIRHKIKRTDLAAMAGVAPENVSRVMKRLDAASRRDSLVRLLSSGEYRGAEKPGKVLEPCLACRRRRCFPAGPVSENTNSVNCALH